MKKTTLLVMAAGMGSRFGGLKQIEPVGPDGEIILDFSIYDAVKAGFDKAVIIIKKENEKAFREICGKRIEKMTDVQYVFQELDNLPMGFSVPEGRTKPWGTAHAVMCAEKAIDTPFAVINADDFYGRKSFELLHNMLVTCDEMCMVGYNLYNTLTENGTVARGLCAIENGQLKSVTEYTKIDKNSGFDKKSVVSMNMWGLMPDIFPYIKEKFKEFLKNNTDILKSEIFLPSVISNKISEGKGKVYVLETSEKWYGVTYREDTEAVKKAMEKFINEGLYDFNEVK